MNRAAFQKLFWGFLLIMLDFRIQGIDVLPDVIGYYFFYSGMLMLSGESEHFQKGSSYAIIMMILSVFSLYEAPASGGNLVGPSITFSPLYFLLTIASVVLGLLTAFHLFRGIQEMAMGRNLPGIEAEAGTRWTQLLLINLATLLVMVLVILPFLFVLGVLALFIVVLIYTVKVLQFIQRCSEYMEDPLLPADEMNPQF